MHEKFENHLGDFCVLKNQRAINKKQNYLTTLKNSNILHKYSKTNNTGKIFIICTTNSNGSLSPRLSKLIRKNKQTRING